MSPKEALLTKQQLAEKRFLEAYQQAKRDKVNVVAIIVEVREQERLSIVRCFGLLLSFLMMTFGWFIPPVFQVVCFKLGMPYALSEFYYIYPSVTGMISTFAFGLGGIINPFTGKRLTGVPQTLRPGEHRIDLSGRYIAMGHPGEGDELGGDGDV